MEAVILCGGMGTRLKEITGDLPKPMVDVNGRPFLDWMLESLAKSGFKHVVLAVGYRWETIREFFGDERYRMNLSYAIETEPLGTGGAICNALQFCIQENVVVLNGDTMVEIPFQSMMRQHVVGDSDVTIAGKWMDDCSRYGILEVDDDKRVVSFREKQAGCSGYINAGVYVLKRDLPLGNRKKFSFENDFLDRNAEKYFMKMFQYDGLFIDIGIPEDYSKALNHLSAPA